jgi:competence protein ComEA
VLAPHERRLLALVAAWLAAGAALDALSLRRPQVIVPLVGGNRFPDLVRSGEAEPEGGVAGTTPPLAPAARAADTTAGGRGQRGPAGKPVRGLPQVYDALGRLDLNAADSTELELLGGVGPALAGRILAERARRGRFAVARDLLAVRGVGPHILAKLLPQIVVRPPGDSLPDSLGPAIRPKARGQIAR